MPVAQLAHRHAESDTQLRPRAQSGMSSKTARITQEHLESPEFQGQAVRAVGKLLNVTDSQVQLQLAGGGEGGKASHSQRSRVPARS